MTPDDHLSAAETGASADLAGELLNRIAGTIPPDRMPAALASLEELLGFLEQLNALDLDMAAPAAVFDPSWDES